MTSSCEWGEVNHRLTLALPEAITLRLSKVRHAGKSDDQGYVFQSGSRDAGRDVRTESSPKVRHRVTWRTTGCCERVIWPTEPKDKAAVPDSNLSEPLRPLNSLRLAGGEVCLEGKDELLAHGFEGM